MNLIKPFKSLIEGGVSLHFKIAAAGDGKVQLDILPVGKDTKTGVGLPPKALVGTAEEIDNALEDFLQKYAPTVTSVAEVVANADAEMREIEEAARAQTKAAVTAKRPAATGKPAVKSPVTKPKRDMKAGLIGGGEEDDDAGDVDAGTDGDRAETVLQTGDGVGDTAGTNAGEAKPQGEQTTGLSADIFNV